MVTVPCTCTINPKLLDLARKEGINRSFALEFGIRKLLNTELDLLPNETIELIKPEIKIQRVQRVMQAKIIELNEIIEGGTQNVLEIKKQQASDYINRSSEDHRSSDVRLESRG